MVWGTDAHAYVYLCWCLCTFCAGMKAGVHGGVRAHVCASMPAGVHACVCAHVGVYVCVCASLHADVHPGVYACVYAQVGVCTFVCEYAGRCGCVYVFRKKQGLNIEGLLPISTYSYTHTVVSEQLSGISSPLPPSEYLKSISGLQAQ